MSNNTLPKKHYNIAIDALRILAILAVIMIHSTTQTLQITHYAINTTPLVLFLNQISRFAVPLFFLISGFVLELSYRDNFTYARYIKRRTSRILVPYIFWSFFYSILIHKTSLSLSFITTLLLGNAEYHLYFIPTLIIFYAIFPFLHKNYRIISQKKILIPILIGELLLLAYDYYINTFALPDIFRVAILNFGVFLIGIITSHHETKLFTFIQKGKYTIAILLSIFTGGIYYESKYYYLTKQNLTAIYSQYRPLIYLYTLLLGGFLFYVFNRGSMPRKLILTLSKLSFFVFFIHVELLEIYQNTIGQKLFIITHTQIAQQLWYDIAVFILISIISFTCAYIIHKIPHLNKITG